MAALLSGDPSVLRQLIDAGADVNAPVQSDTANDGKAVLHMAAARNNAGVTRLLLAAGADVNARDVGGSTPLFYVARPEVATLLIEAGADVNAADGGGDTALHFAAAARSDKLGVAEIVHILLQKGADPNARNLDGKRPLMIAVRAVRRNDLRVVRDLLASGARVNASNSQGNSVLHLSILQGQVSLVELLLDSGADPNRMAGVSGRMPIHEAVLGHPEILAVLIEGGADISARTRLGRTALDMTRPGRDAEVIAILEAATKGEPLPIGPGFDCARARSNTERAICADKRVARADYEMVRIYSKLHERLTDEAADRLVRDQRTWLRHRATKCLAPNPDAPDALAQMAPCLLKETTARGEALEHALNKEDG